MMDDRCKAFNEPEGGTCLVRCAKEDGHQGRHEGAYRIRPDGVTLHRKWDERSPQHRDDLYAARWASTLASPPADVSRLDEIKDRMERHGEMGGCIACYRNGFGTCDEAWLFREVSVLYTLFVDREPAQATVRPAS